MKINLNGKPYSIEKPLSIEALLHELDLQDKRVAIELNQHIIPRSLHKTTYVKEGDELEVIEAIAGG